MARPIVIDSLDGTRMPFLRGILTRSLQHCGLSFEDAYSVASEVRSELAELKAISSNDLRRKVGEQLKQYGSEVRHRYEQPPHVVSPILIGDAEGQQAPFSRGAHSLLLERCGLLPEQAGQVAASIHDLILAQGRSELSEEELHHLTHARLGEGPEEQAADAYLVWEAFRASGQPLVILLGGAPGTGKSAISSQLAHLLDISRNQPTDMLREVMRVLIPERLLPVLHRSSFMAAETVPEVPHREGPDAALIEGYLAQAELVRVACEAVVHRALAERLSLVLEGVHIHPGMLAHLPEDPGAIIVPVMLAVMHPKELRRRLRGRGKKSPGKRAQRFLANFDDLWKIQAYLLDEADRTGVPIVENDDREQTVHQIINVLIRTLAERFPPEPG